MENISNQLLVSYKKSFKNYPLAVCLLSDDEIVFYNKRFELEFHLDDKKDHLGESILKYIPRDYHKLVLERINQRKQGLEIQPELKLKYKNSKKIKEAIILAFSIPAKNDLYTHVQFNFILNCQHEHEQNLEKTKLNIGADLNFLNFLIDTIPNPIYYKNQNGIYIGCNEAFERFMGIKRAEILGRHPKNVPPIILANIYHDGDVNLINKKGKESYEGKARDYKGEIRDIIFHKAVFFNTNGETGGMVCTLIDITKQKYAKKALKESEVRVKLAIEASMLGLWDLNLSKHTIYLSPEYFTILGYAPNEYKLRLENWLSSFYDANNNKIEILNGPLQTVREKINGKEYKVKTKSGEFKWVLLKGKVVEQAISRYDYRITGTIRDISAQKEAELALFESELRFRSILETSNDAIAILIEKQEIVYWNDRAKELFEFESFELNLEEGFKTLFSSENWIKIEQLFSVLEQNKEEEIEVLMSTARKEQIPVLMKVKTLLINHQLNYVLIIHDLREAIKTRKENKKLQEQLLHAQKMETIGKLAGGIAHDFNNILTPIMGYTQMVMASMEDGDELKEDLEHVYKAANRAKDLVKQILSFSRRLETEKISIFVHLIIKETLSLISASITSNIKIESNIHTKDAAVFMAPSQLHQVLMNICTNAYQAMKEKGGLLKLELDIVEHLSKNILNEENIPDISYVRIKISDTGGGIPHDIQSRIFEPFFTTKGVGEGTGLGLSVVHGIIKDSNGTILLESKLNKGTLFTILLPAVKGAEKEPEKVKTEKIDTKLKVLVIDDEQEVLDIVSKVIRNLGFVVIEKLQTRENPINIDDIIQDIAIIVSDQIMPNNFGVEIISRAKELNPQIKAILMTGYSESLTDEKAKNMGVDKFLLKPIIIDKLAESIIQLLN